MGFVSSNINLTSRVEQLQLTLYNCQFCSVPVVKSVISQIFSRISGLLISPAALIDCVVHMVILPFSVIYAIGRSIYQRKCDFILPWQHLQRVRDSVFPILFGSIFGLIHPHMGVYAAEPTKKHIATGILLSGTEVQGFNAVCSPMTAFSEIESLHGKIEKDLQLPKAKLRLLKDAASWEGALEKVQAIDFLSLNLTYTLSLRIYKAIDTSEMPAALKAIIKRISLIAYPIFVTLDLIVFSFATLVCLGIFVVRLIGGQSPAYLEKAASLEVLIYNIVKIPIFLVGSLFAFLISIMNPEKGVFCPTDALTWAAFKIKMLWLRLQLYFMKNGESMLLPSVQLFPGDPLEFPNLLPIYGRHMRYILVKKEGDKFSEQSMKRLPLTKKGHFASRAIVDDRELEKPGCFSAELIERGDLHKKLDSIDAGQMQDLLEKMLALRFRFGAGNQDVLQKFNMDAEVDLGKQTGLDNCIVTNFFASMEVLFAKEGRNNFVDFCRAIKIAAMRRYDMYAADYYPFGDTQKVLGAIQENLDSRI